MSSRIAAIAALVLSVSAQTSCCQPGPASCGGDAMASVPKCVCLFDPFCCDNAWDSQCVNEAVQCGSKCDAEAPTCGLFAEPEVPLRLGTPPTKCIIVPDGEKCYDPSKYAGGTKASKCEAYKDMFGDEMYFANAGLTYPGRRSLSDEELESFCLATTCINGFEGPLVLPTVFEHLVEISTNCLITPAQLFKLQHLAEEWQTMYESLKALPTPPTNGPNGQIVQGGSGLYQIFGHYKSLMKNKRYNQIAMYTYFQAIYTTITFEFVGQQGYQEALLTWDDWLSDSLFTKDEKAAAYGKTPPQLMWMVLQREEVTRCYPVNDPDMYTRRAKDFPIWPSYTNDTSIVVCTPEPRATEAEIHQAIRALIALETNFQLFGGIDIQSFVPRLRLPNLGSIIDKTDQLCQGEDVTFPSYFPDEQVCILKLAFCEVDEQVDFSGLSNRQLLSILESAYFAGSDEWRGFFELDAMAAFGEPQEEIFIPECADNLTAPSYEGVAPCLNWKRKKVVMPNALDQGVFGPPLRQYDPSSPTGFKMRANSSNFDLALSPERPLSLAEYCTAISENRFKGTVRGRRGSALNREDNTICCFRHGLLVDFFQNLDINPYLNYLQEVSVLP